MKRNYSFEAELWIYPGDAAWHFVSLPKSLAKEIKETHAKKRRGFGSLRVRVTIEKTTWSTSIFPDSKSGTYLLPVKASIRKALDIGEGDHVKIQLTIE